MEIKFLDVSYKEKGKYLFKKVNLEFKEKRITGIYQDNLKLLPRLLIEKLKYTGSILLDNKDLNLITKPKFSYIDKISPKTFLTKTVSEEFYLIKKKIKNEDYTYIEKIASVLKMVGLNRKYLTREITTLSKSEKRLLQFALNLITNPKIIIIDEPFLYLDKESCFTIKKILFDLKRKYKKNIIILSDNINTLYELTDDLIILKDNQILIKDKTISIFNNLDFLLQNKIELPNLVLFNKIALNYNQKLTNYKEVNDLIKEVYRCVRKTNDET